MRLMRELPIATVLLLIVSTSANFAVINRPFDEFGEIDCESEMASGDNFLGCWPRLFHFAPLAHHFRACRQSPRHPLASAHASVVG